MARFAYEHVHLISPDLVRSAQFYEDALGATNVAVGQYLGSGTRVELNIEGARLPIRTPMHADDCAQDIPGKRHGPEHFGLRTDNIEEVVADLKNKGIEFFKRTVFVQRPSRRLLF
jgi:lactoylglutathione lyase